MLHVIRRKADFSLVCDNGIDGFGRRADIDYKRLTIHINPEKRLSVKCEGLLHELLHAISTIYANDQLEENEIESLAEGLWQVFEQLGVIFDFSKLRDISEK